MVVLREYWQNFRRPRTNRRECLRTRNRHPLALPAAASPPAKPVRHDSTSRRPFQRATPGHRPPLRPRSPAQRGGDLFSALRRACFSTRDRPYVLLLSKNPPRTPAYQTVQDANGTQHANLHPPRRLIIIRNDQLNGFSSFAGGRNRRLLDGTTLFPHFLGSVAPRWATERFLSVGPRHSRRASLRRLCRSCRRRMPPAGRRSHNQHVRHSFVRQDCRRPFSPCSSAFNVRRASPASCPAMPPPLCGENPPQFL